MIPFQIIKINAIDSSNNEIKRLYHKKLHKNGLVIWTDNQTNGRGQGSKKWVSQPNKNLTFSVYLDSEYLPLSSNLYLNLITSLCIKKVLICHGIINPVIKWPNDILSVNKKISGILIENLYRGKTLMGSIIGVGININQITFPKNINATSMKIIMKNDFILKKILEKFLEIFSENLLKYRDWDLLKRDFNESLFQKNETIEYEINGIKRKGKIIGINDHERFQILNLRGAQETPKIKEVKIIY